MAVSQAGPPMSGLLHLYGGHWLGRRWYGGRWHGRRWHGGRWYGGPEGQGQQGQQRAGFGVGGHAGEELAHALGQPQRGGQDDGQDNGGAQSGRGPVDGDGHQGEQDREDDGRGQAVV